MPDILLLSVRFALFADLMAIVGIAAFLLYAFRFDERRDPALVADIARLLPWLAAVGFLLSIFGMWALAADMLGVGLPAVEPAMLAALVEETSVGAAWLARTAALAAAVAAAIPFRKAPEASAASVAIAGSVALVTLVWSGHAGASEGWAGTIHRASDGLHMMAAAVWLGAIAAFLILLHPGSTEIPRSRVAFTARSLDQFGGIGTASVAIIAATGLVNGQMIVGAAHIGRSFANPYGQLLLAKLLLFMSMLGLAGINRWRLAPALHRSLAADNPDGALRAMRRSLLIEASAGTAILALVGWLGMLDPMG